MVTRTWSFHFCISKYLDCMQYSMILLEQCSHIVMKALATVTRSAASNIVFAWSRDWTTLLPLLKTLSTFCFHLCHPLKLYVLHCTRD